MKTSVLSICSQINAQFKCTLVPSRLGHVKNMSSRLRFIRDKSQSYKGCKEAVHIFEISETVESHILDTKIVLKVSTNGKRVTYGLFRETIM